MLCAIIYLENSDKAKFSRYRIAHSISSSSFLCLLLLVLLYIIKSIIVQWEYNLHTMLLYALGDQASVTGFIEFLGIAEPDQVVGGVLVGVLNSVIHAPRRKVQ